MSNVRGMNIDKVDRDLYENKTIKKNVLNKLRELAYSLKNSKKLTEKDIVEQVLSYAQISIDNGVVSKEEVLKEIAKIIKGLDIDGYMSDKGKSR